MPYFLGAAPSRKETELSLLFPKQFFFNCFILIGGLVLTPINKRLSGILLFFSLFYQFQPEVSVIWVFTTAWWYNWRKIPKSGSLEDAWETTEAMAKWPVCYEVLRVVHPGVLAYQAVCPSAAALEQISPWAKIWGLAEPLSVHSEHLHPHPLVFPRNKQERWLLPAALDAEIALS